MLVLKPHYLNTKLKALPRTYQPDNEIVQKPVIHEKIAPIRVVSQKIYKPEDIHKRLILRASKHVTKVAAVGPETLDSLSHVRRAKNVKTMRRFEFDPYMAETSCLSALKKAYNSIKKVCDLNIVIRRLDKEDIVTQTRLFIHKFRRLTKLRAEFVDNGEENKVSPTFYLNEVNRCYSLKSLKSYFINVPLVQGRKTKRFIDFKRNLLRLEEFESTKVHTYTIHNPASNPYKTPEAEAFRLCRLKKCSLSAGIIKPGWVSISEDESNYKFVFLDFFRKAPLLEELNIQFIKFPTVLEFFTVFINELIPTLTNLKRLRFSFIKCQVGDIEMLELRSNLHRIKDLKQFTIKIFQYPNVSADLIRHFVGCLSKHSSIEKFDFYTRRLDMPDPQVNNLINSLENFKNVECKKFNQSLHVFKNNLLE